MSTEHEGPERFFPASLVERFPEMSELWPKLLRRARPEHLRNFGIPDLTFRLECQLERERAKGSGPDARRRAAVWYHVAEQCSPGMTEIPSPSDSSLREWALGKKRETKTETRRCMTCGKSMSLLRTSKFFSCRNCRKERRLAEKAQRRLERTGKLPEGWKLCEVCGGPFEALRHDAKYCQRPACRQKGSRDKRRAERRGQGVTDTDFSPSVGA